MEEPKCPCCNTKHNSKEYNKSFGYYEGEVLYTNYCFICKNCGATFIHEEAALIL